MTGALGAAADSIGSVLSRRLTRAAPSANQRVRSETISAEAPRPAATVSTAGLLARGSPPVTAFPDGPVAQWYGLAAYSCGGSCGFGTFVPHRIPCSLSYERPSILAALNDRRRAFVNAALASL